MAPTTQYEARTVIYPLRLPPPPGTLCFLYIDYSVLISWTIFEITATTNNILVKVVGPTIPNSDVPRHRDLLSQWV